MPAQPIRAALAAGLLLAAAGAAFPAGAAEEDVKALLAEIRRLSSRIEALEQQQKETEKSLASERISEQEPELVTRLKAVEFQTLSMQKQARQIEALEGITVGASLTGVVQKVNRAGAAAAARESRTNYRGDLSVTLPGGEMGQSSGKIFAHLRLGQGNGVGLVPTYASTPNTTAFQVGGLPADDSFGILAQAWYQLTIPFVGEGLKANAREHMHISFGKIDPFVFFDQNAAADDESARFMNNAFVHNPLLDSGGDVGADAYGFAPGLIVQYVNTRQKGSEWALSLGMFGSSGVNAANGANWNGTLSAPLVIAQAETTARFNFLPGNYRAYAWSNGRGAGYDNLERRHGGLGLSADQRVSDHVMLFGRYGHQVAGRVRFDRALTLGAELNGSPWGRGADALGLAVGSLRTSAEFRADSPLVAGYQASGSERQVEIYYRFRVNNRFELTPDFQWFQRPGGNGGAAAVKVAGLRAKVGF